MKSLKMNKLVLISFIFLSTGCDCLQTVTGIVVDRATGDPLSNAVVYKNANVAVRDTTDGEGNFELSDITGSNNCNNIRLVVEKLGYNQLNVIVPNNEDIILQMSN